MALNKLPGQMLRSNLLRGPESLTVDTDLLHYDVANRRIGVRTVTPAHTLSVVGSIAGGDLVFNAATITSQGGLAIDAPSGTRFLDVTPDTFAAFDSDCRLVSSTGIGWDGTTLVVSELEVGNITISGTTIASDASIQIVSAFDQNIQLIANGSGDVILSSAQVQNLAQDHLVISGIDGELVNDPALRFTSGRLWADTGIGVGDMLLTGNALFSGTSLDIEASEKITLAATTGLRLDVGGPIETPTLAPGSVVYTNNTPALATDALFAYHSGILAVPLEIEVADLVLRSGAVDAADDLELNATGRIVVSQHIEARGINSGDPLLLTTNQLYNAGMWVAPGGSSVRIAGGNSTSDDSTLGLLFDVGRWTNEGFPTGAWNPALSVLEDLTVVVEQGLVANSLNLGNISISDNTITTTTGDLVLGAADTVVFAGSGGTVFPVGTTAERPLAPAEGTVRYNLDIISLEMWNGTAWAPVGVGTSTVESDRFSGNGVDTDFALSLETSTIGIIVVVNGLVQIPYESYSVTAGTTLAFSQAPDLGDEIEVRYISVAVDLSVTVSNPVIDGGEF